MNNGYDYYEKFAVHCEINLLMKFVGSVSF